jgi:hypothetical protein
VTAYSLYFPTHKARKRIETPLDYKEKDLQSLVISSRAAPFPHDLISRQESDPASDPLVRIMSQLPLQAT